MKSQRQILRILRLFYQGFRLITAGLKKEIEEIERELSETSTTNDSPELNPRPVSPHSTR